MRQLFARLAGARAPWRYLFALVSGGLWALSFPQPGISILAWFAFVPLFVAAAPVPPKIAFRLGLVTGLAAYGTLLFGFTLVPARVGTSMAPADFLVGLALTGTWRSTRRRCLGSPKGPSAGGSRSSAPFRCCGWRGN